MYHIVKQVYNAYIALHCNKNLCRVDVLLRDFTKNCKMATIIVLNIQNFGKIPTIVYDLVNLP